MQGRVKGKGGDKEKVGGRDKGRDKGRGRQGVARKCFCEIFFFLRIHIQSLRKGSGDGVWGGWIRRVY